MIDAFFLGLVTATTFWIFARDLKGLRLASLVTALLSADIVLLCGFKGAGLLGVVGLGLALFLLWTATRRKA